MSASIQGACSVLLDVSVGSVTRALLEASASVALWLQYLILQVMAMSRLATSNGADIDSWVGDFGLIRLPGTAAVGAVTLTCLAPQSQSGVVPAGTTVKTSDGQSVFAVSIDPANPFWSSAANSYIRPAGTPSINVPIRAMAAGSSGNVQAGTINLLGASLVGIDIVTNQQALFGGLDAETDASLRARFVTYINSRSRATIAAVENAVTSVQQGLTTAVIENFDSSGDARLGTFTVVVDDGSGAPPADLLASVSAAVDAVRPIGSIVLVVGPTLIIADISLQLLVLPGADVGLTRQHVATALTQFVDGLAVGAPLAYTRLANVAYQADANVANVLALSANNGTTDLGGSIGQVVRPGTITVS